jgi:hypothetical protein
MEAHQATDKSYSSKPGDVACCFRCLPPDRSAFPCFKFVLSTLVTKQTGKLLQAVKALNHAKSLSSSHPEVHVRTVELQRAKPPTSEPQASIFKSALLPEDLPLDRYNAEYIQKNPSNAAAAVASARVSKLLGASQEEFEELLIGVTRPEIELTIPVIPFESF